MGRQRSARVARGGRIGDARAALEQSVRARGRRPQRVRGHRPPQRRRAPLGQDPLRRRDLPGVARAVARARRSGRRARGRRRAPSSTRSSSTRVSGPSTPTASTPSLRPWRRWEATPAWSASSPTCAISPTGCRCASRSRRVPARRRSREWTPSDEVLGRPLGCRVRREPRHRPTRFGHRAARRGARAAGRGVASDRRCARCRTPSRILFIDGVRRIDARVWIEDAAGDIYPGLCASYAAGAVCCEARADVVAAEVGRGVFSTAPTAADIVASKATYPARMAASSDADGLMLAVHERMAQTEVCIAEAATSDTEIDLIVIDGPLRGRQHSARRDRLHQEPRGRVPTAGAAPHGRQARESGNALRCSRSAPPGAATRGTCACRARRVRPGPASCAANAHPISHPRPRSRWPTRPSAALPRFASEAHKDTRAPAEPVSDRRPRARATASPRRPGPALPQPPAGRPIFVCARDRARSRVIRHRHDPPRYWVGGGS